MSRLLSENAKASYIPGIRGRVTEHGFHKHSHPLYRVWAAMHNRCKNPNVPAYVYYGARGISVCERWSGSDGFLNFLTDMGPRPDGLTLERVDNDGNYEPSNCKWATREEQRANRRDSQ